MIVKRLPPPAAADTLSSHSVTCGLRVYLIVAANHADTPATECTHPIVLEGSPILINWFSADVDGAQWLNADQ